jgi:hypothetical protein
MYPLKLRATLVATLALFLSLSFANASSILRNDLLKIEAVDLVEKIGKELREKSGVHTYVIATNEHFPVGFNLVNYTQKYESNLSAPYVVYLFAPYASITKNAPIRGRVGIIPSSSEVSDLYDYEEVRDAGVDIIAVKDSNSDEDKFNIGVVQALSVLADNIASHKGVELETTIKDEMGTMVMILRIIVYSGTAVLLWIFMIRPRWQRRRDGKTE